MAKPPRFLPIGMRLKATREALGLRPVELYSAVGISQHRYSQWEGGLYRPSLDGAIALCDRYGLSLDWLYRGIPGALPYDLAAKLRLPPV